MEHYRSVFISDVHLGTKMCQAELLLDFLKTFECDSLYLVGDLIDGWALSKNFFWPQSHNDVIQKILRKGRKGTKIYYIAGNHDEFLRVFAPQMFGNIVIEDNIIHTTVDGRKIMVLHGDQFDVIVNKMKWLSHLGSWAYDVSIMLNTVIAKIRNTFKLPYWSLSAWAKYKVKKAVNFISDYEESLLNYAKSKSASGIICGHIHHANIRDINGLTYMNCGDWVESCTALVEHADGRWEIIRWVEP